MHPYLTLPEKSFWSKAVAQRDVAELQDLWQPKRKITARQVFSTFGSCFAQHIGRALVERKLPWLDAEPAPLKTSVELQRKFNYGIFSARTGNIYTANQLAQWVEWATGASQPPAEVWELNGRFYDPFRPRIEPNGFASLEELIGSRQTTIGAFRECLLKSDTFVFTMGLTEGWVNEAGGYEYAACPGTVAGTFDAELHKFKNYNFAETLAAMRAALRMARLLNPKLRFLLTVSPVPLTATASEQHVLVATMRSKAILRAVAAQLAETMRVVDYFPSYEIVSSPWFENQAFEGNRRSVKPETVASVMAHFFASARPEKGISEKVAKREEIAEEEGADDLVCEEALLDAFAKR